MLAKILSFIDICETEALALQIRTLVLMHINLRLYYHPLFKRMGKEPFLGNIFDLNETIARLKNTPAAERDSFIFEVDWAMFKKRTMLLTYASPDGFFAPTNLFRLMEYEPLFYLDPQSHICDLGGAIGLTSIFFSGLFAKSTNLDSSGELIKLACGIKELLDINAPLQKDHPLANYVPKGHRMDLANYTIKEENFLTQSDLSGYDIFYYYFNHFQDMSFFKEIEKKICLARGTKKTYFLINWAGKEYDQLKAPFNFFKLDQDKTTPQFRLFVLN